MQFLDSILEVAKLMALNNRGTGERKKYAPILSELTVRIFPSRTIISTRHLRAEHLGLFFETQFFKDFFCIFYTDTPDTALQYLGY